MIDIVNELKTYHAEVDVYDPWIDPKEAKHEYRIEPLAEIDGQQYDVAVVAVAHRQFQ